MQKRGLIDLTGPPGFSKPRDIITWVRHQGQSPAIIIQTIRPSGLIMYVIFFIKYELNIVSKNGKNHRCNRAKKYTNLIYRY